MFFGAPRRRRRSQEGVVVSLIGFLLIIVVGVIIVKSDFGLFLSIAIILSALFYGSVMVRRQAGWDHTWHAIDRLRLLSGIEFERHVAELYRRLGYEVELTRGSGDQGVDVLAESPNQRLGIQCKQWSGTVGNDAVQQALAGRTFYNCSHGAVVCTSTFTRSARELAERANIQLIDGVEYAAMVNRFNPLVPRVGLAALFPRGRAAIIQTGMIAGGLAILILHFSLRSVTLATPVPSHAAYTNSVSGTSHNDSLSDPQSAATSNGVAAASGDFSTVVEQFYSDLNDNNYAAAYALMSPRFQAASPYDKWMAGYSSTISTEPNFRVTDNPAVLSVTLVARENLASGIYTTVYHGRLQGARTLTGAWLLDGGSFQLVSRTR